MGIFEPKPFEKIPDEDWMRLFEAQRDERSPAVASLSFGDAQKKLGPNLFRLQRVRSANSGRDDSLRDDETAQVAVARGIAETVAGTGHHRE